MARKPRKILRHKKTNKFLPPKYLDSHHKVRSESADQPAASAGMDKSGRLKEFAKKFSAEIKRAARAI